MWIDLPNWQAQSSFVEPVAPPGVEPLAAPLVCLQVNATWLPYITGALMQLAQPAAWATADPTALAAVLQQATDLISSVGGAEGCTMLTFRFTVSCVLQFSLDGGATWQDVSGWPSAAPGCYTGATGATGATGPAFIGQGDAPPNPQGATTAQQACNIAGYLAVSIVQASLQSFVDSKNAAKTQVQAVAGAVALLSGFDPIVDLIVGATAIAAQYVYTQTTADYTAALADPAFLSDVQCALYTAISATGYVTAANFAAVLTNLAAISYTHADVVTTVHDFVNALGLTGLQMMQVSGTLYVGDCSSCAGSANCGAFAAARSTLLTLASDVTVTSPWTMGGWIDQVGSNSSYYIALLGHTTAAKYCLLEVNAGLFRVTLVNGSGSIVSTAASPSLRPGQHHIAVTLSGTLLTLYVDGVSRKTDTAPAGNFNGTAATAWFSSPFTALDAQLKRWGVWNSALSGATIATWYAGGNTNAALPAGAVHQWLFDEGTGTTAQDSLGGDNGTFTGTPPFWGTF